MTKRTTGLVALAATLTLAACGHSQDPVTGGGGGIFNPGTISNPVAQNYSQSIIAVPNVPTPTTATPPGPNWSIDVSTVDQTNGILYLADRTNCGVDVFNIFTNTYVGTIGPTNNTPSFATPTSTCASIGSSFAGNTGKSTTSGPNGIILIGTTKMYAGDGNGTVKVLNLTTKTVTSTLTLTGAKLRTYEGSYDPDDNIALITNDQESGGPVENFINTTNDTLIRQVKVSTATGMEGSFYSPTLHKFVLAIPVTKANKNGEIDIVDPTTGTTQSIFPLPGTCGPMGVAQGTANTAIVACSDPGETYIVDVGSGSYLTHTLQAGGGDGVSYDATTQRFFIANSNNTTTGVKGGPAAPVTTIMNAVTGYFIENVPGQVNGHTVATYQGKFYVPFPNNGLAVFQ
jgi:hypothetical protein